MTRIGFAVACGLIGLALAPWVAAQDAASLPPLYEVEVLIFAHTELDRTEEDFSPRAVGADRPNAVPVPRLPSPVELVPLEPEPAEGALLEPEPADELPAAPEPSQATPSGATGPADPRAELRVVRDYRTGRLLRFRPLRADELDLGGHYRTLTRLGAYEPLLHVGWLQEALGETEATPVDLSLFGTANPAGSIKLHLSRFLHVTLDLAYQGGTAAATAPDFGLGEISLAPRYRLQTQKRIRNGALNYFDHPAFGVLVMVRFVDPPAPAPQPGRPVP